MPANFTVKDYHLMFLDAMPMLAKFLKRQNVNLMAPNVAKGKNSGVAGTAENLLDRPARMCSKSRK